MKFPFFLFLYIMTATCGVSNNFAGNKESEYGYNGNLSKKIDDDLSKYINMVNSTLDISEILFYEGKIKEGLGIIESNLSIISSHLNMLDTYYARLLIKKGKLLAFNSFTTNSGFDEGLMALNQAENILKRNDGKKDLAEALLFKGFLLYSQKYNNDQGSYDSALVQFNKSLELRKSLGENCGIAEAYIYIGIISERKGFDNEAKEYYKKSLEIADEYDCKLEKSYAVRHLAFHNLAEGNLDLALEQFKESLALRKEVNFKIYLPFSYLSVGQVYDQKGIYNEANFYYKEAYESAEELNSKRIMVLCLLAMGPVQRELGKKEEALATLAKAKDLSIEIGYEKGLISAEKMIEEINKSD